jgi:hypothetical protein
LKQIKTAGWEGRGEGRGDDKYKTQDGAENGNSETRVERNAADSIRDIDSC